MGRAWRSATDEQLVSAIRDVGTHLEFPPSEHVAFVVRQRLEQAGPAARRVGQARRGTRWALRPLFAPGWSAWPAWQRVAVVLALLVAILSGALVFSPGARRAVAGWLGLRGVKITVTPAPSLPPVPLGRNLALGVPVSLAEAQASVPFKILLPSSGLGFPDEIDLLESFQTGQVSLLYQARPGIPTSSLTGAGLLLTEFQAKPNEAFIEKTVLASGSRLESVTVKGEPGFWIEGAPHELFYVGRDGQQIRDTARLAGNVLLWQHGSVTLRLEGSISKARALAIAASVA
jgi:hypothetical protein